MKIKGALFGQRRYSSFHYEPLSQLFAALPRLGVRSAKPGIVSRATSNALLSGRGLGNMQEHIHTSIRFSMLVVYKSFYEARNVYKSPLMSNYYG
jgi:hypothetical protein